jgi:hypothetical protein
MWMYDGRGGIAGGTVSMVSSDARGCVGAGPFDRTLWFARATAYILNACHGTWAACVGMFGVTMVAAAMYSARAGSTHVSKIASMRSCEIALARSLSVMSADDAVSNAAW